MTMQDLHMGCKLHAAGAVVGRIMQENDAQSKMAEAHMLHVQSQGCTTWMSSFKHS